MATKIEYARIVARHTPRSTARRPKPESAETIERRAADIAKMWTLPMLRAWAATYVSASAEERQTAAEAMKAEERSSLLGPAPRARLRSEVTGILRRAAEREERGE